MRPAVPKLVDPKFLQDHLPRKLDRNIGSHRNLGSNLRVDSFNKNSLQLSCTSEISARTAINQRRQSWSLSLRFRERVECGSESKPFCYLFGDNYHPSEVFLSVFLGFTEVPGFWPIAHSHVRKCNVPDWRDYCCLRFSAYSRFSILKCWD